MPSFSKQHLVQHGPQEMFNLVADVEKYPEFVPLCEALTIRTRREKAGREILVADMSVGYKAIRETFTSQVILNPELFEIDVKYVDGPFKYLTNIWRFEPKIIDGKVIAGCCLVHFSIDYEFKSKMLGLLMGSMFDAAFQRFTKAFEERANAVYGSNTKIS